MVKIVEESLRKSLVDLLIVHIVFAALAAAILLLPMTLTINVKLLIVVCVYNILLPGFAKWRGHTEWTNIWIFSILLSFLMVIPDWFLAEGLGALNFIDKSFPMIGPVPAYMAGLWAIPFFIIIYASEQITKSRSALEGYIGAASLSLMIFGAAEASMWMLSSWETLAQVVIGNIALYILVPEMILGVSALFVYRLVKDRTLWLLADYLIMALYIGNAALFYLFVELLLA